MATVRTVGNEALSSQVLLGKQLFYLAGADTAAGGQSRMSLESYLSCATCHIDGGTDHRTYDFSQRGEGLRNTIDLRGRSGTEHGNLHWSANFDEVQDFEIDIVEHFEAAAFSMKAIAPAIRSVAPMRDAPKRSMHSPPTSAPLACRPVPRSPYRTEDGKLTERAIRGAILFADMDCASCHDPESEYTDSSLGAPTLRTSAHSAPLPARA